jgi:aldose 1-epimerase
MEHLSDDFPGNLDIVVTYTLTSDNSLLIDYDAVSDAETVINLTHHAYFNLAGHASGDIHDHVLELDAPFYMPIDNVALCTGEIREADSAPFDFREGQSFGEAMSKAHPQLDIQGGFDHNFLLSGEGYRHVGSVSHSASGRRLNCYTTLPCIQLYTYNINDPKPGKDGVVYNKHQGFCLETQTAPNAAAMPWLRSPIYAAGVPYRERSGFRFGVL